MSQEASIMLQDGHRHMREGYYETALRIYNKVIEKEPRTADAHYHMGNAIIILRPERADTAIDMYGNAIALNPYHSKAHFKKALELSFSFDENAEALRVVSLAMNMAKPQEEPLFAQCTHVLTSFILFRLYRAEEAYFILGTMRETPRSILVERLRNELVFTEDERCNKRQLENLAKLLRMHDYLELP